MTKVLNSTEAENKAATSGGTGLTLSQALELSGKIVRVYHRHKRKSGHPVFDKHPAGGAFSAAMKTEFNTEMSRAVAHAMDGEGGLKPDEATSLVTHVAHLLLGGAEEKD